MAVAYRSATSGTDLAPAEPSGAALNDIIIAEYYDELGTGATVVTPATGFTEISFRSDAVPGIQISHGFYWARRGAGTIANNWAASGTASAKSVSVVAYSGAKQSGSPINVASAVTAGSDTTAECTSITTTVNDCMIIGGTANSGFLATSSTDYANERIDQAGAGGHRFYDDGLLAAAGATGTMVITAGGASPWFASQFALEPETGGAAPAGLTADPMALVEILIQHRVLDLPVWAGSPAAATVTIEGVAAVSFGGTFTVTGVPNTLGVASATFGFTATANGHIVERGVAAATFGFTATAAGIDRSLGQAVVAFGFTATALGTVGTPPVQGQATATFGGTFTAAGVPRTSGTATALYGGTFTASGVPRTPGVAAAAFGFTATALGIDRAIGQATATFGYTATASGIPRTRGVAVTTFGYTATAAGFAGTPPVQGQASVSFGFTATGLGVDRSLGQAVVAFGFTATATGHQHRVGTATGTFGYTATAVGRPRVLGQATASFGFTAAIFIITYKLRLVAVGGNRYTATSAASSTSTAGGNRHSAATSIRYSGAAGGNRYSVEED